MRIQVRSGQLSQARDGVSVFAALEGEQKLERLIPVSSSHDQTLAKLAASAGFRGAANETLLVPRGAQWPPHLHIRRRRIVGPPGRMQVGGWALVVGLGKEKDLSLERIRQFAGTAARTARSRGFRKIVLPVLYERKLGSAGAVAQALAEGALLGVYRYDRLREVPKHERRQRLDAITVLVGRSRDAADARKGVEKGEAIAEAVQLARDLINGPSNLVTPTALANEARRIAKRFRLKCAVTPFAQLKRRGFGGIVGVAQGSHHPAQFIVLEYAPPPRPAGRNSRGKRAQATFVFCGKGITFDSGGISLKSAEKMEQMKYDMSGAAAVLGALQAAAALKLPHRIVGIVAATENLPSGTAQKPGDVLKTLSGKTVEVINTDAEGRLVLADCLHYAKRYKPACVVDLATLTGACVTALGHEAIGLFTKNERLASRLNEAGKATYERVWRLPLWDEYAPLIKSDIADLKNAGSRDAGATTAAKFLEEFAQGLPWAHLDIAGTAWAEADKAYTPKGAVGVGVRLLIRLLEQWK